MQAIDFIKSDIGITISWLCTVASCIYGLLKTNQVIKLQKKISIMKLKIDNIDQSHNLKTVNQSGEKNVITETVEGNLKINM